MKNAQYVV